jgi:hypothetical protein
MNSPESVTSEPRIPLSPRSPTRATLLSAFAPGAGQIYNKQLEKAVLFWIWFFILLALGIVLLVLGMLGRGLPSARAPLSVPIAAHAGLVSAVWAAALFALWVLNIRDARVSAGRINRGEIIIRHPLRWQWVHVLGSQVLGFIPLIGFLFPPGIIAEAMDARRERRKIDQRRVLREGGAAVVQWAITRVAFYAFWILLGAWVLWWTLRGLGWVR